VTAVEAEVRGSQAGGHSGLLSKTILKKKIRKKEKE
jgi:hypothetical protein